VLLVPHSGCLRPAGSGCARLRNAGQGPRLDGELSRGQFPTVSSQCSPCVFGVVLAGPKPGQHLPQHQDSITWLFSVTPAVTDAVLHPVIENCKCVDSSLDTGPLDTTISVRTCLRTSLYALFQDTCFSTLTSTASTNSGNHLFLASLRVIIPKLRAVSIHAA